MKCSKCPHCITTHYGDWDCYCELRQEALENDWNGCRLSNKYLLSEKAKERVKKLDQEETEKWVEFAKEMEE